MSEQVATQGTTGPHGPVDGDRSSASTPRWKELLQNRSLALLPVVLVAVLVGFIMSPVFLTQRNIINLTQQSSELAIVVVALSLVLISGKFDLSLESTFALAPMVGAFMILPVAVGGSGAGLPPAFGIIITVAVGLLVGLVNGFLVIRLELNAFIVTIAMLILLRGVTLGIVSGRTLFELPDSFLYLGQASWIGIPVSLWVAGLIFVMAALFLRYHRVGRALYAIGGNAEAARAAGINVARIQWGTFVAAGGLAALAGLALAGRTASVTPAQGTNLIFSAFAAAVIGGISLNGGRGTMLGAFLGVLLLAVITNILTLSQIPSFWIDASNGAIILVAILISRFTAGKEEVD
jgi:ribose/xylose/arabinose/galactoside ABC-type transport system permease subunit